MSVILVLHTISIHFKLWIVGDNITVSHTEICLRGQNMSFLCTAKDLFEVKPLMELWDGTYSIILFLSAFLKIRITRKFNTIFVTLKKERPRINWTRA